MIVYTRKKCSWIGLTSRAAKCEDGERSCLLADGGGGGVPRLLSCLYAAWDRALMLDMDVEGGCTVDLEMPARSMFRPPIAIVAR